MHQEESDLKQKSSSSSYFDGDPTKPEDAQRIRAWFNKSKKKDEENMVHAQPLPPKNDKSSSNDRESEILIRSLPILPPWLNDYAATFKASQVEEVKVAPYKVTSIVETEFTHPWLQRKQMLLKQTTIKKKHWRAERQDTDVVDIDGKK